MDEESATLALMNAYRTAVINAAAERGTHTADFGEALASLPAKTMERLRANYDAQLKALDAHRRDGV